MHYRYFEFMYDYKQKDKIPSHGIYTEVVSPYRGILTRTFFLEYCEMMDRKDLIELMKSSEEYWHEICKFVFIQEN